MSSCTDNAPSGFTGHWRDWHRGHGCDRDDGKSQAGHAKIASAVPMEPNAISKRRCYCQSLGTLSLRSGDICGFCESMLAQPSKIIAQVCSLGASGKVDAALDLLFLWINTDLKMRAGQNVNELLASVEVTRLDEDLIVGILTASFPGRALLTARSAFADRARARLITINTVAANALIDELMKEPK